MRRMIGALEIYEVDRLDFAEAYLAASAEATGVRGRSRRSTVSIALVALTSAEAYDRREGRAVGLSPRVSVRQVAHATPAYRPDSACPTSPAAARRMRSPRASKEVECSEQ